MSKAKKKSSQQIEEKQSLQETKRRKTTSGTKAATKSNQTARFTLQDFTKEDIVEIKKIKAITPYAIASKLDIKISTAKKLLTTFEKNGTIQQIASGQNLKIYRFSEN